MKNIRSLTAQELLMAVGLEKFEKVSDYGFNSLEIRGWDKNNSYCIRMITEDYRVYDWNMDLGEYLAVSFRTVFSATKSEFEKIVMPIYQGENVVVLDFSAHK